MQHSLRVLWADQRGIVLVLALMLMGLLSALAAAYVMMIRVDTVLRGAAGRERKGFYAAEAGLNFSLAGVRDDFNNQVIPTAQTGSINIDSGARMRTVTYVIAPVAGRTPGPPSVIPAGQPFSGLYTTPSDYTLTAVAKNAQGDAEATVGAQFTIDSVPLFQFLAFYQNTLEMVGSAPMTVSGRIHTNSELYLDATLTIGDLPGINPNVQVSAAGDIHRGHLDDTTCGEPVIIDKLQDTAAPLGDLDSRPLNCVGGKSAKIPSNTLALYLGSLLSHVTPLQVPSVATLARGTGGTFWDKADLRIVLRADLPAQVVTFNDLDLCPGDANVPVAQASPALLQIEVQDKAGGRDNTKTRRLWKFMCQRRGAIFYNELPAANVNVPANGVGTPPPANNPSNPDNYVPVFGSILGAGAAPDIRADYIYRRAGEDTNGDGVISNTDRNDDICPVTNPGLAPNTKPSWVPTSCPWPNAAAAFPTTSWYRDTDYRRGGFYNRREQRWVRMLNVNLRALIDWNEANGDVLFTHNDNSDGGLVIFLSVQAADSTITPPAANRYGVRIFDAADLNTRGATFPWPAPSDPTGLTVVSDQAIYVEGNYNTVQKYPAAVIGDTINVLSQTWEVPRLINVGQAAYRQLANDRKSATDLGTSRRLLLFPTDSYYTCIAPATPPSCNSGGGAAFNAATSFGLNAALIAGQDLTIPGQGDAGYNGGFENYFRFHEDWLGNGITFTTWGSLISLGQPRYSKGKWCGPGSACNIYSPPLRTWNYEVAFNDVRKLPPLTPMVNSLRQRMYTRFYE